MLSFIVFPELERDCVLIVFNLAVTEAFYVEPEINRIQRSPSNIEKTQKLSTKQWVFFTDFVFGLFCEGRSVCGFEVRYRCVLVGKWKGCPLKTYDSLMVPIKTLSL